MVQWFTVHYFWCLTVHCYDHFLKFHHIGSPQQPSSCAASTVISPWFSCAFFASMFLCLTWTNIKAIRLFTPLLVYFFRCFPWMFCFGCWPVGEFDGLQRTDPFHSCSCLKWNEKSHVDRGCFGAADSSLPGTINVFIAVLSDCYDHEQDRMAWSSAVAPVASDWLHGSKWLIDWWKVA